MHKTMGVSWCLSLTFHPEKRFLGIDNPINASPFPQPRH